MLNGSQAVVPKTLPYVIRKKLRIILVKVRGEEVTVRIVIKVDPSGRVRRMDWMEA